MPGHRIPRTWQHDPTKEVPDAYKSDAAYEAYVPDELSSLAIDLDPELAQMVGDAERQIRGLNDQDRAILGPLARMMLRTESISSTNAKRSPVGARELLLAGAMAESGVTPGPAALELLARIDAMQVAVDDASRVERFGVDDIVAIHRRLLGFSRHPRFAGELRTLQNWIGGNDYSPCGADFVPPPPEEMPRLLDDLCRAVDDESLPPLVQASIVHAQFVSIHPFDDGNGRVGRALVHVVLRRRGVAPHFVPPIPLILGGARNQYFGALDRFRGGDAAAWVEHFAVASLKASRLANAYVDGVEALRERWQLQRSSHEPAANPVDARRAIVDALPANPVIAATRAAAITGRTERETIGDLDALVAAGVLVPHAEGPSHRWWEAAGVTHLVAQLEFIAQLEADMVTRPRR